VVFEDKNQNGIQDEGEKGLSEVLVSDGFNVATTDEQGHYELELRVKEYRVIVVENRYLRLDIVPELGGRIYRLIDKKRDIDWLYIPQTLGGYGGYEEYSTNDFRSPGWNEEYDYKVFREGDQQIIILSAQLDNGYSLTRRISLKDKSKGVVISSSLKNTGSEIRESRLRIHPIFVGAKEGSLYLLKKQNRLRKIDLKKLQSLDFKGDDLPQGLWFVIDKEKNIGLANYFDPGQISSCYLYGEIEESCNLELLSRYRKLKPGESLTITHKYILIGDAKKMLSKFRNN
jgi:hypothetical protein